MFMLPLQIKHYIVLVTIGTFVKVLKFVHLWTPYEIYMSGSLCLQRLCLSSAQMHLLCCFPVNIYAQYK